MERIVSFNYRNLSNRNIAHYRATYGVPIKEGVLADTSGLALHKPDGTALPVQVRVTGRHLDRSIKWLLLSFALPVEANERGQLSLVKSDASSPAIDGIQVEESADQIQVRAGKQIVAFDRRQFSLFKSYRVDGAEMLRDAGDIVVTDHNHKRYFASLTDELTCRVVESGPLRVTIEMTGKHTAEDGAQLMDFRVRYELDLHDPAVKMSYKFINCEPPETGVKINTLRIDIPTELGRRSTKLLRQSNHGRNWMSRTVEIEENVDILCCAPISDAARDRQAEEANSWADGIVILRNLESLKEDLDAYPHYLRPGNARSDMMGGLRCVYPYVAAKSERGTALFWFEEMENHFPKGLSVCRNVLSFDIWPDWCDPLQFRRGMAKEHVMYLSLQSHTATHAAMEGIYFDHEVPGLAFPRGAGTPIQFTLDPGYVREAEVLDLHRWLKYDEANFIVEDKFHNAGTKGVLSTRGMIDVGDEVSPNKSFCANNEDDLILYDIREYYRRQEPTKLFVALKRARHNAHIDFVAFDPDDPLRQGTMPAHCPHHTDGAAYPSHMWVEGLLAAFHLTGESDFEDVALSVGHNMLSWQTERPDIFYLDSRECGWPMLAYLALHAHTLDDKWLAAAHEVFEFYQRKTDDDGAIQYELPHGVGTVLMGYGEFITWRACYFYYERTGNEAVKAFLLKHLTNDQIYHLTPARLAVIGWGSNDLFPAWAAYQLTGDKKYLEDNYAAFKLLLTKPEKTFGVDSSVRGGVDVYYFLDAVARHGDLAQFCQL